MEDRMTAQQLKNSILQMAVQGKLVPQDPNDEPASVLLERIRKEKEQLIKDGKIKKNKKESYIFRGADNLHYEQIGNEVKCIEDELPFEIPDTWQWVKLGYISTYEQAKEKIKANLAEPNLWELNLEDIEKGGRILQKKTVQQCNSKGDKTIFKKGDILYSKLRPYLLKILIADEAGICTSEIVPFHTYNEICSYYVVTVLKSPFIDNYINSVTYGVKMPRAGTDTMINLFIPLPPVKEQNRIIECIHSLEPLIQKYQKIEEQLYELNSNIKDQLKKSILQYAIEGKLVPQDPNDEPASVLLDRIRKEKQKLIAVGKIKKDKNESIIYRRDNSYYEKLGKKEVCIDDKIPFGIPNSWEWKSWGDISFKIQYGFNASAKQFGKIKMVRISDIQDNSVNWNTVPYCDIEDSLISDYLLHNNDILFARTGGTVGKSFLVENINEKSIYAGYLIRTVFDSKNLNPKYLKYFMESELYWSQLKNGTIATAQPNCNGKTLSKMKLPIPPLNEQNKLVNKIQELEYLCSKLTG